MTLDKVTLNRLFMTINAIIVSAMMLGLIFYCVQVNYESSIHNIDNITLANNATVGRIEHSVQVSHTNIIYLSIGFVSYALICVIICVLTQNPAFKFGLYPLVNIMPIVVVGSMLRTYINDRSWFFVDTTFFNSKWSTHLQNSLLPILNCSTEEVKIDYDGNYTVTDCWNFEKSNGEVYTQCGACSIIESLEYDLDNLVWGHVINTTVYVSMLLLAQIIDMVVICVRKCVEPE